MNRIDDKWVQTRFRTTPRMSSYLLAVIVSEFSFIEGHTKSGTRFRIWARPEAKNETTYALESGIKCIEHYEEFYGIPFPLPKQDMVALPDFSAGAMENWGLITYRENSLLYNPDVYRPQQRQRVAVVVAHELAHQWFGNLVTMRWWNDLWLNEGFASFVEFIGTDFISNGNFRMTEQFLLDAQESAFDADAMATSHPLSFRIDRAVEVQEAFDAISYDKGASVISMIRNTMGPDAFDKAIRHVPALFLKRNLTWFFFSKYLETYAYDNAEAMDLYTVLADSVTSDVRGADGSRFDVIDFAKQWTMQMGYPVLNVHRAGKMITVKQSRYLLSNGAKMPEKYAHPTYGFTWDVPVWYSFGGGKNASVGFSWLPRDSSLTIGTQDGLVPILNYDSRAFARVNYEPALWRQITTVLNQEPAAYSIKSRTRLISDAFAMAEAGLLDYEIVFNLTSYLGRETEYLPWITALSGYGTILSYFGSEPEGQYVRAYMRKILEPQYKKASIEHVVSTYLNDSVFFENLLESSVIASYVNLNKKEAMATFVEHFRTEFLEKCAEGEMASKCSNVAVPLRANIYCAGVKSGDRSVFDKVFAAFQIERNQVEKSALLSALACSRDIATLKELLIMAIDRSSNLIRLQDADALFGYVSRNPIGNAFILNFFFDRYRQISDGTSANPSALRRIIKYSLGAIRSRREIREVKAFQEEYPHTRSMHSFTQGLVEAEQRVAWLDKHFDRLTQYFRKL